MILLTNMATPPKIQVLSPEECKQQMLQQMLLENGVTATDSLATIALKLSGNHEVERHLNRFITQDASMLIEKDRCRKLAPLMDTVLITGPTGTGKELFAKALSGSRTPFLPLNCSALNESLVESELFGHKKGAFTDAKEDRKGILAAAEDGTVYLDEIDKMSDSVQAKLLRAIQEHEIRPVGSEKYYSIKCRFVCSSKVPLAKLVEDGKFLEDLYARISTFELHTTSLEHRLPDVALILERLLIVSGQLSEGEEPWEMPESWMSRVYRFNVRAIESYVRNVVVFGRENVL